MSLGLSTSSYAAPLAREIRARMMTTLDTVPGHNTTAMLGLVEAVAEKSFSAVRVAGLGVVEGGSLADLVEEARILLAGVAADRGANAVVGLRYEISGRELEKSVLVYGTAVHCDVVK